VAILIETERGKSLTRALRTLKITVTYDGSAFFGFQIQPSLPTVQAELERALGLILSESVRIAGSGRTDTGVHAVGQVVSLQTCCPIPVEKLIFAVNGALPVTIRVISVEETEPAFHARFSAKSKHYRYLIQVVRERSPFLERFYHQVDVPLDVDRMNQGARRFLGAHDFSAFTKSPGKLEDPVRQILESNVSQTGQTIFYDVVGTGFLHNMVRNMSKALILIGSGKMEPDEIDELYRNQDRKRLGAPASPGGLYLMRVMY